MRDLLLPLIVIGAFCTALAWRPATPEPAEVSRLQAHFDTVDAELRAADLSHLTPAQRASRAQLIAWLRDYRDAATFPLNDRFTDRRAPFFRDTRGVLCAMAYLIERSGHGDLVDRIARTRNNAYLRELASDPALLDWLRGAGLSVAEAARIQPAYTPVREYDEEPLRAGYANTSMATATASLASMVWNGNGASRASVWAGRAAGVVSLAVGVAEFDSDSNDTQRVAAANVLVGILALGYAGSASRATGTWPSASPSLRLLPAVLPARDTPALGLSLVARF